MFAPYSAGFAAVTAAAFPPANPLAQTIDAKALNDEDDDDTPLSLLKRGKSSCRAIASRKRALEDIVSSEESDEPELFAPRPRSERRQRKRVRRDNCGLVASKWMTGLRPRRVVAYEDREGAVDHEAVMALITAFYREERGQAFTEEMANLAADALIDDQRKGSAMTEVSEGNAALRSRVKAVAEEAAEGAGEKVMRKLAAARELREKEVTEGEGVEVGDEEFEKPLDYADAYSARHSIQFNKSERLLFEVVVAMLDEELWRTREEASLWKPRFQPAMQEGDWEEVLVADGDEKVKCAGFQADECGGEDEADEEDVCEMDEDECKRRDAADEAFVVEDDDVWATKGGGCEPEAWETAEMDEEEEALRAVRRYARELARNKDLGVKVAGRVYVLDGDSDDDDE